MNEKLTALSRDNIELVSKLGVTAFEKKQAMSILDSIDFGIIIMDLNQVVTYVNEYMLSLLNCESQEIIGSPLEETVKNQEITDYMLQQEGMQYGSSGDSLETTFEDLAPGDFFSVNTSFLKEDEGAIIGIMLSIKDITAKKLSEKNQKEFVAHLTHELLTPLTSIKSYSEMLMDGEIDDTETQNEFYNTINEETNRLTGLIKDLLNISKMDMGSLTIEKTLVKTDWLVEDCMPAVEATAYDKNIRIEKNMPDNYPSIIADKEMLKVAIINILGNAVKYTPNNGTVIFTLMEQQHSIVFEISDTGYGISKEDLPHVFDRFYRSAEDEILQQTGSGLGLAITQEIIQLHDGKIEVQSEIGKGTQFTITLPKEEYYLGKE